MINEAAHRKMQRARSELVLDHPFFAHLALRLEMREDPTCRTAWSDGRVLAYNPLYVESLPLGKLKGMQCHEVLHLVCNHHTRRNGRDERLWNMACDYAINPVLLEAGIELPSGYLDNPAHHGQSAEAIYAGLLALQEETHGGAEGGSRQGEEVVSEQGSPGGGAEDGDAGEESDAGQTPQPQAGRDDAGGNSGAEGESPSENTTEAEGDPGMSGEVRDSPSQAAGDGAAESLRQEEQSWRAALSEALHKAREFGSLPGSLERLLDGGHQPALDWRELLRRFLYNAARNDFSWARPNRRFLHTGLYLPGLHNEELAQVAVAVDVSGSITPPELERFASELSSVLEEFDAAITVFTCDAAITRREHLSRWDLPLEFTVSGGGGTDFCPPFEHLREEGTSPACLIYFTDMECGHFPEEPEYPVLWVTANGAHTPPPFGDVLLMPPSA